MSGSPRDPAAAIVALLGSRLEAGATGELERLVNELRRDTLLAGEQRWLGRLGWRLSRPLLASTILAVPAFLLQDMVPPAQGLALFAIGAAAFFVVLQLYVQRWTVRVEKALAERESEIEP